MFPMEEKRQTQRDTSTNVSIKVLITFPSKSKSTHPEISGKINKTQDSMRIIDEMV